MNLPSGMSYPTSAFRSRAEGDDLFPFFLFLPISPSLSFVSCLVLFASLGW
jgi:hypothetical protein